MPVPEKGDGFYNAEEKRLTSHYFDACKAMVDELSLFTAKQADIRNDETSEKYVKAKNSYYALIERMKAVYLNT